ncbi:MAG: aldehyde ferredoxin oxidoreductase family protein [Candidatus Bathyarchaeia archaeon]
MRYEFARVLYIDLSRRVSWLEEREELFNEFIGGIGVAIKLLQKECPKGIDPLSPENPIIFAVGPFTGVYPTASKTIAVFKSPLTKNLGESHCGGRSAVAIKMAGYDAIVIKGASETPVYLAIHGRKVYFRDGSAIWNMANSYTVGRILRDREPGAGIRTIMRIGRAGENLIPYACVVTETYRHFGRLGLGAVFGSKKLKAIVISGKRSIGFKSPKAYREFYNKIFNSLMQSPSMKKYHELGTSLNINPLNELKALPTRNLKEACFEDAKSISGENFAQNFLGRRTSCAHCPVSCIHLAVLRTPYETEPYFYKTKMISYDYELLYSLGSMLGISNPSSLLMLLDEVEALGLDAISTGVALAWATEAQEKGLISIEETNGLILRWGNCEAYLKAIRFLVNQVNDFYKALSKGIEYASSIYGGKDFALVFGKNEMPGYHTGPAAYIGYLIGSRHSHLDSAGYSLDQKILIKNEKLTPKEIVERLINEEGWRQVLSSLIICFFAREIYTPELIIEGFKVLGKELSIENLKKIGVKILKEKYRFKTREGFNIDELKAPERIFQTPTPSGKISKEFMEECLKIAKEKLESLV